MQVLFLLYLQQGYEADIICLVFFVEGKIGT